MKECSDIYSWGVTLEIVAQGNQHEMVSDTFFLVYDKYKEIKMYLVVQVILHVHTCTWFPTTKINHKKVDVILKSALGMKCSGKNITIQ